MLPELARLALERAARAGKPGSMERTRAVNAVMCWARKAYPECFRDEAGDGGDQGKRQGQADLR